MMNPLPAIIPLNEVMQPEPLRLKDKQYILCITKDLSDDDKKLFAKLDVEYYNDKLHRNLPISSFDFDVLVMDLREQSNRYAYIKEVEPRRKDFYVIVYSYAFEKDQIVDCDNQLFKFPEAQPTAQQFLEMLLIKRISKPRAWMSLFKCILASYQQLKA